MSSKFIKSNTCLLSSDLSGPPDFDRPYRKKSAVDFSKIFKTVSNDQELQTERVLIHRIWYIAPMTVFLIRMSSNFMKSTSCLLSLDLGDPSDFGRPYRKKSPDDFSKIFKIVSNDQELQTERVLIRRIRYILPMTGFLIKMLSNFMKSTSCLLSLDLGDPSDFGRPYRKTSCRFF